MASGVSFKLVRLNQRGYSLIEVLIALGIFAIGFLAVASMQVSANLGTRNACEVSEAYALAANQMENLMLVPFDEDGGDLDPAKNPHQVSNGKYMIEWSVADSDLNADGINEAKTVQLSASWKRLGGTQRTVKLAFVRHDL
jgi:prepilin-type N-terminal cleavage/methylation domain-containing protein